MRDMTNEAVEVIDKTRLEMAGVEGVLTWVQHLAEDSDMAEVKRTIQEQKERLSKLRMGLNKSMFDNAFSPFGFDLKDE
jgi:hypothetical protein